jgi:hypothetical protein
MARPNSEAGVDGIAKRLDDQGIAPTKPLSNEIPARRRKEYQISCKRKNKKSLRVQTAPVAGFRPAWTK